MVILDKCVFVEMPRTGSTHIMILLVRHFGGQRVGMHQPATEEVLKSNQHFIGTIRNPWDWYISKWTIGCGGTGDLHQVLTRAEGEILSWQNKGLYFNPEKWQACYKDETARDVGAFRRWLKLLFDERETRKALPQRYGASDVCRYAGFFTYSYLLMYCKNQELLNTPGALPNYSDMNTFENENFYITQMVHTENIAEDLIRALHNSEVDITSEQMRIVNEAAPTNPSHRSLEAREYYDDETIQLVYENERFIIDKFNYKFE